MIRFIVSFLLFVSAQALGVELIQVPEGVVARVLDWEGPGTELKGVISGHPVLSSDNASVGRKDLFFSNDDLCRAAAYWIKRDGKYEVFQPLSHLCRSFWFFEPSLTFAFITDTQDNVEAHKQGVSLVKWLRENHPSMRVILHGGDFVQYSRVKDWQAYRKVAEQYTSTVPIVPIHSNHDYILDSGATMYNKTYGTERTKTHYYTLDFGAGVIIALNSNTNQLDDKQNQEQTKWLEDQLKKHEGQQVIVAFHHATKTSGSSPNFPSGSMEGVWKYVNEKWAPLFDQYQVKLVLNGHDHLYERSLTKAGVTYINGGPAGGKMGEKVRENPESQLVIKNTRTVTLVTVSGDMVKVTTYDYNRKIVDEVEL